MWSFELPIINLREWLVFVFFYVWKLRLGNLIFCLGPHTWDRAFRASVLQGQRLTSFREPVKLMAFQFAL